MDGYAKRRFSDGYQFLEIAGDREAYLGDFGPRRGWLKQKSSEGGC